MSTTTLDVARIEALHTRIRRLGALYLNSDNYKMLLFEGFSRRDVDRAIETLVQAGEAIINTSNGAVCVRLRQREEKI